MIAIIDYGMGNMGSILNMLKKIGAEATVSVNPWDFEKADKLVLPGVGSFDNGMKNLEERGMIAVLQEQVLEKRKPILGICLGMQLLTRRSEEGVSGGLGWIQGETVRFRFAQDLAHLKVPHMGWNEITVKHENVLFRDVPENPRFYFVHSYHVRCDREQDIIATTRYGYDFVSAVSRENIFGVQFHPEKSHKFGMAVLSNFARLS